MSVIVGQIFINGSYLFQKRFNVYSCKAHDIDSGRARVAGRREHDDMPLPHMVAKGKVGFIPASVNTTIYLIIRRCARTGAFPGAFCVPNSVALASLTLEVVNWAIH